MPSFDLNATTTMGLASEGEVDFAAFADEPSQGAWPNGWYAATVIEGYATRKGHQFITEDVTSKNGDSRNIRFCFAVVNTAGETRNIQEQYNYKSELLLTSEGLTGLAEARKELKGVRSWPGEAKAMQSSSITLGKLGQFQKALGLKLKSTGISFDPSVFVGQRVDVKLSTDTDGFNKVTEFSKAGEKARSKR
jgi:hypothetical protein